MLEGKGMKSIEKLMKSEVLLGEILRQVVWMLGVDLICFRIWNMTCISGR